MQSRRKFLTLAGSAATFGALGTVTGTDEAAAVADAAVDGASYLSGATYPTMGTDLSNPTATVFGNFKCPHTQEFVLGNLDNLIWDFVETGRMNIEFRTVAYEPDPDDPSHGSSYYYISSSDPRISEASLGVWDVQPEDYWRYFLDMFQDQVSGWVTLDELIARMDESGVGNLSLIRDRVASDAYEDAVKRSTDAAQDAGLPWTPYMVLGGDGTSPHHDLATVEDWIEARLPDGSGGSTDAGLGEAGTLATDQSGPDEWHAAALSQSYADAVVVAGPPSSAGPEPAHVRLDAVSDDGFRYQFEEWEYLDGYHVDETAHFVAAPSGNHALPTGGTPMEVGTASVDQDWTWVGLDGDFGGDPVVVARTQTTDGPQSVVTRLAGVTADGFHVRLQEEEAGGWHRSETVGYVALQPGGDTLGDAAMESGLTGVAVDDSWTRIDFERSYASPRFVAGVETYRGDNTVSLRYRNLTESSVEVRLQEEQSADEEVAHLAEQVGYVVVEGT